MALPEIDFRKLRSHQGNQDKAFEELCCQLAALEDRPLQAEHHRKGPGADAGVECFTRYPDHTETGWQAKFYWQMDASLTGALDKSIQTALQKHPDLNTYIVCIPFDPSDARTGKGATPLEKWRQWHDKWVERARSQGRELTIVRWGASELRSKLVQDDPHYAGRVLYWFDQQVLTQPWFERMFDKAKADLGSRYTPATSVQLPLRRALLAFARDSGLFREVEEWARSLADAGHEALRDGRALASRTDASPMPKGLDRALAELDEALSILPESAAETLPVKAWQGALEKVAEAARTALEWARRHDLAASEESSMRPDEMARRSLWKLCDRLEHVQDELGGPRWTLVNAQQVLVYGEGGSGKSHLLADAAAYQLERARPAVLLLGQKFILGDPWRQILDELDLRDITANHFLGALDAAAEAAGVRGLVMIDALNERAGPQLWPDRLPGLLHEVNRFPHLGVVLSCRTSYLQHVVPDALDEQHLPRLEHRGFVTRDARDYLSMRGFVLPGAPTLGPEFGNPLFLKTCCDALEKQGMREFPRGIRGTTAIYTFYIKAVADAVNQRLQLEPRRRHVERAVNTLAETMAQRQEENLPAEEVDNLLDEILPSEGGRERNLLTQLESEGLLTVEMLGAAGERVEEIGETVRFTFQRISDYAIAEHLLKKYVDPDNPFTAFAENGPLFQYAQSPLVWRMAGVVEALAVQLPERSGVELPDAVPESQGFHLARAFQESLLWRDQSHFTARTLELVQEFWGEEQLIPTLLRIATEPDNRFNAHYLHAQLEPMGMPRRDQWWSAAIAIEDLEPSGPVVTLIDWAWDSGFGPIENERAELAAIALTWCLTTSHRAIRDRSTKALVALLASRPELARGLLERFWPIDDDYLRERLLATLYGALLQGQFSEAEVEGLAQAVYDAMFVEGRPPVNALMRDHGRGVIEYAMERRCVPAEMDVERAHPPYQSDWPLEVVPEETIQRYTQTGRGGQQLSDQIVNSCVHDGDFARYVIDRHARHWSPAPIGTKVLPTDAELRRRWLEEFEMSASEEAVATLDRVKDCSKAVAQQNRWADTSEREALQEAETDLRELLTLEQWDGYRSRVRGWIHGGMAEYANDQAATCDQTWARRWICKRAHELGWSEDLHAPFDNSPVVSMERMEHRVERIGKKYQWLALYELVAHLADHCAMIENFGSERSAIPYDGESPGGLRNIDPSLLVRRTFDDGWTMYDEPVWWAPILPRLRPMEPLDRLQWLYGDGDLINDQKWIEVNDPEGRRWLTLHNFLMVRQGWRGDTGAVSETWARLDCVVVRKSELQIFVDGVRARILTEPHAAPHPEFFAHDLYLGEYPWHPAFASWEEWTEPGEGITPLPVSCGPTATQYTCERGGYDRSPDQTVHVQLPAAWLMEALSLRLADGRVVKFVDGAGKMQFFDPSLENEGPKAGLIDRDAFLAALEEKGFAAVWIVAGEKNVYGHRASQGFGGRYRFTSLYWTSDNQWQRRDHQDFLAPLREQVRSVLNRNPPSWVHTRD